MKNVTTIDTCCTCWALGPGESLGPKEEEGSPLLLTVSPLINEFWAMISQQSLDMHTEYDYKAETISFDLNDISPLW